jgi:hypothetical protein
MVFSVAVSIKKWFFNLLFKRVSNLSYLNNFYFREDEESSYKES